MALGETLQVEVDPAGSCKAVAPVSVTNQWTDIIDAGGPANQDAATITNPTTEIVDPTTHIFQRKAKGTNLLLRLAYDDGLTGITDPVVKVFGRTGDDAWQLLKTRADTLTGTLVTAATDTTDGTLLYTTPDWEDTTWDCLGCDEILVGIETALAGTGTVSNSVIQAKFV